MNKKTVFLIRNVGPEQFGGGESYQIELGVLLKKNGFFPIIFTNSRKLLELAKKDNIETVIPPYNKRQNWSGKYNLLLPFYYFWQIRVCRWYRKQIAKNNPIAVNIQSRDEWIAATRAGWKSGVKIIWTDHADFRTWVLNNVKKPFKNCIGKCIRRSSKKVDDIVAISDFEANYMKKNLPEEAVRRIKIIKNGALDKKSSYSAKPKKGAICFIGRVVDYKGIRELIEAFKIVSKNNDDVTLNIYGDGDVKKYQQLARGEKIIFHDYTNSPLEILAENDIFVLPSYKEGLSLSLLDAAMMGKKIIATNVDGNPEVIENEETGLLVRPRDAKELATAISRMLKNESEANSMAKKVRQLYEKKYNFEKTFDEEMLPLYQNKE